MSRNLFTNLIGLPLRSVPLISDAKIFLTKTRPVNNFFEKSTPRKADTELKTVVFKLSAPITCETFKFFTTKSSTVSKEVIISGVTTSVAHKGIVSLKEIYF